MTSEEFWKGMEATTTAGRGEWDAGLPKVVMLEGWFDAESLRRIADRLAEVNNAEKEVKL